MIDYEAIKEAPLAFTDYFAQWGAKPWQKFIEVSFKSYLGGDLTGKKVLELGPGFGRMSCLMALLGGEVTAIDVKDAEKEPARELTQKLGVESKVEFIYYDGNLDILGDRKFDLIFTKSVLVYPADLRAFLEKLESYLNPDGRIVFIENARGNSIFMLLRWIKRHNKSFFRRIHYFTKDQVGTVKSIFNVELSMCSRFPPVYLFCGKKK